MLRSASEGGDVGHRCGDRLPDCHGGLATIRPRAGGRYPSRDVLEATGATDLRAVAVDIGATKWVMAACAALDAPQVVAAGETGSSPRDTVARLSRVVEELGVRGATPLACAFAGSVDVDGRIARWPNRPQWQGFELGSALEGAIGGRVVIDDDGICAGYGEMSLGHLDGQDRFVCVSFGTGVASGIFVDGRPQRPQLRSSFSIGHVRIGGTAPCPCGAVGCLQAELGGDGVPSAQTSERAADLVADVAALLDLEAIVVTGGRLNHADFRARVVPALRRAADGRSVRLLMSPTPDLSAVAGALALAVRDDGAAACP